MGLQGNAAGPCRGGSWAGRQGRKGRARKGEKGGGDVRVGPARVSRLREEKEKQARDRRESGLWPTRPMQEEKKKMAFGPERGRRVYFFSFSKSFFFS